MHNFFGGDGKKLRPWFVIVGHSNEMVIRKDRDEASGPEAAGLDSMFISALVLR